VLETTAGPEETLAFVAKYGLTHAAVFAADRPRRRQLAYLDARLLEEVETRAVQSRTLSELGPPEEMLIYELQAR
jgi:hypothetical protein